MANKEITFGSAARAKVKAGIDKAADAVRPTLGPVGMTSFIEFKGLDPVIADDGVSILRHLEFKDPYENMGLQMLRKGALRTSSEGGDGTATTTVLGQAFVTEAFKEIASDSSKIREVRERLEQGLASVLAELSKLKREVKDEDIERIANISTLDPEAAKIIAEIIKEVGVNGVVAVDKGARHGFSKEIVKGARFNKGLISPFFINDHDNKQTVLEDAYIVLVDRKISTNEQIISLINSIGTGKDILFIADTVESVALATLAQNAVNKVADIACVSNPYSASRARDFLFDMAALTGATVISEEMGMKLDEQTVKVCGRADKVIVTKDTTTIIGGRGNAEIRIGQLQSEIGNSTSEYEKTMLEDRLAALSGGIGVIRVGAYTDTEFHAKKLKFENGINATQAALQEGILPGGGMALFMASSQVKEDIFRNVLRTPFQQMATNAGIHPDVALSNLAPHPVGSGYDFKSKQIVNLFDAGIIDPYKVVRLALESAVAIASQLVSMENAIVQAEEPKNENQ